MKTRILVISEQFSHGGLETQVAGQACVLSSLGVDLLLATGSSFIDCPKNVFAATLTDLQMGAQLSFDELRLTLERLKRFISDERVTMIHVHPFYSAIVGLLAAQQSRLPFVVTIHGPISLSGMFGQLYDFLLKSVLLPAAGRVYCVSKETELLCHSVAECRTELLPNAVEVSTSNLPSVAKGGPWLWAGRLDADKSNGLLDLIEKVDWATVSELHIFGDGPQVQVIESFLHNRPDKAKFVRLMGWRNNLTSIMPAYAGVAGMGRVLLEGAASNRPCLLVGYDGVKGLLDVRRFELASFWNLSGRGLPTITAGALCQELDSLSEDENHFLLREWITLNRDERTIWKRYALQIKHLAPFDDPVTQTVLDTLQYRGLSPKSVWWDGELFQVILSLFSNMPFGENRLKSMAHQLIVARFCSEAEALRRETAILQDEAVGLKRTLEERDTQIAGLNQVSAEHDGQIAILNQAVVEREGQIASLNQVSAERDAQIASLNQAVAEHDGQVAFLQKQIQDIWASTSWRITSPLRFFKELGRGLERKIFLLLKSIYSGFPKVFHYTKRSIYIFMNGGFPALYSAIRFKIHVRRHLIQRETKDTREKLVEPVRREHHLKPLLDDDIVIFAGIPFDDIGGGQRAAQLARCALKTGRRVLYVYIYKKFNFEKSCYVDSVVDLYNLSHVHISDLSVEEFIENLRESSTILFELPHPEILKYLEIARIRGIRTVFELIDAWDTSLGGDWFDDSVMQQFIDKSDYVIGTARMLKRILVDRGRTDAIYLPNAANEYLFDKYKTYSRPSDMPSGLVGLYFGTLNGEWFAWDYLYTAARENTQISFCLIGDKPSKIAEPQKNVHFLGAKKIEELPAYLNSATFCILPFATGKISDAVSPIKVFEYLFMEKPVVSTALLEVANYPGVYVAESPVEFSRLCAELSSGTNSVTDDLFITHNSWYGRLQHICGAKGDKNVTAIILIHNNKPIIERCLSSLIEHCETYLAEIIVVDNTSTDGGADLVCTRFPHVRVVRNHVNGCASGRNLGISMASGKYIAFFDSDQWFTSSACFAEALSILKRDASIGAVSWAAGWFDKLRTDLGGPIMDYLPNRGMNQRVLEIGYREDVGYLGTGGFFTPRSVVEAAGGFDEAYDPTCFEDTDLSFGIKKLGLKIVYRNLTGIRHQPHQTSKASTSNEAYLRRFKRNAEYFKNKWKDYPDFLLEYREE